VSGEYAPPCLDASISSICWTAVLIDMYLHVRQWAVGVAATVTELVM
jgi:hypothetical protein